LAHQPPLTLRRKQEFLFPDAAEGVPAKKPRHFSATKDDEKVVNKKAYRELLHRKAELEDWVHRKRRQIKRLLGRLAKVYGWCKSHPDLPVARFVLLKRHTRNLCARIVEITRAFDQSKEDYDRLQQQLNKYRANFRCMKCRRTGLKYSQLALNPAKPNGVDTHCKICAREKVKEMRAKKVHVREGL
jgi:hypothetical protein